MEIVVGSKVRILGNQTEDGKYHFLDIGSEGVVLEDDPVNKFSRVAELGLVGEPFTQWVCWSDLAILEEPAKSDQLKPGTLVRILTESGHFFAAGSVGTVVSPDRYCMSYLVKGTHRTEGYAIQQIIAAQDLQPIGRLLGADALPS